MILHSDLSDQLRLRENPCTSKKTWELDGGQYSMEKKLLTRPLAEHPMTTHIAREYIVRLFSYILLNSFKTRRSHFTYTQPSIHSHQRGLLSAAPRLAPLSQALVGPCIALRHPREHQPAHDGCQQCRLTMMRRRCSITQIRAQIGRRI